jgi:predicted phosphohydrolase
MAVMALYAISDLHLSFDQPKPMDKFGENWRDHVLRIRENWYRSISELDVVLIPGDISWAMDMAGADSDLHFINELPGQKVILPGNHDFWWGSTAKLNNLYNRLTFIKSTYAVFEGVAICGARGWLCPNDSHFTTHDAKIYNRELARLERSLASAKKDGHTQIVAMMHFPPMNDKKEPSGFTALFEAYAVTQVIYGHLHGAQAFKQRLDGLYQGVHYQLVSADFLSFQPLALNNRGVFEKVEFPNSARTK